MDSASALEVIKPFFPKKWSQIDVSDVTVTQIKGGYCNSLWKVSRTEDGDVSEPVSLVIRKRGGNMIDTNNPMISLDTTFAVVFHEMSRLKLGPKLYGFFPGGHIEEFIQCHTLTPEESANPEIAKDIATAIARAHCIQGLPLANKDKEMFESYKKDYVTEAVKNIQILKGMEEVKSLNLDFDFISSFDLEENLSWMRHTIMDVIQTRMNVILMDMNYLNCLVKEGPIAKDELRVLLIDYDTVQINSRCFDLGAHFFNRKMKYDDQKQKILDVDFPTDDEKRKFLQVYQQEVKRHNVFEDFDESGLDSVEHLLLESRMGELFWCVGFASFCFKSIQSFLHEIEFFRIAEFKMRHFVEGRKRVAEILKAQKLL